MAELDTYTGETMHLRVEWQTVWSEPNAYYVDEVVLNEKRRTRWGPIPSKELAHALIQERRKMFADMVLSKIPALSAEPL